MIDIGLLLVAWFHIALGLFLGWKSEWGGKSLDTLVFAGLCWAGGAFLSGVLVLLSLGLLALILYMLLILFLTLAIVVLWIRLP